MKYSSSERLIWMMMSKTMFQWIQKECVDLDSDQYRKKVKDTYKAIVERTPDIGSSSKNMMRMNLAVGELWLAFYEAAEGKIDEEMFSKLVAESMEAPLVKKMYEMKKPFTEKYIKSQEKQSNIINTVSNSPANWKVEFKAGRDNDEHSFKYEQCGLCYLGKQENLFHLVKYMCMTDFISTEWMGGVLFREHTLATDGKPCDFYICRKGSKWEKERTSTQ